MGKKKGAAAVKARARRERHRSPRSHSPAACSVPASSSGPIVPSDGQRVRRGLQNLGNTCFMNSIVQCLNVSLPFSDELMGLLAEGLEGVSRSLCGVFRGIRGVDESGAWSGKGACCPKPLREELIAKFPWYKGKEQQDAHELLRTLLGSISDESTKSERGRGEEDGDGKCCSHCVSRSFRGYLCAATLCWSCSQVSLRLDPFLDLSLELPSLAGQTVGALGVTAAMSSGEPTAPGDCGAGAAGSADERSSKHERKERRKRGQAVTKPAKAKGPAGPKAAPGPRGVWAARGEAEELRQTTRALVHRLIVRALRKGAEGAEDVECPEGAEGAEGAEAAEEEAKVEEPQRAVETLNAPIAEIELTRQSKKASEKWGFKWSEAKLQDGIFVLSGIGEETPLEKWNLKCRAMGDDESAICVGDRLIEVNGVSEFKEMRKNLRSEDKVALRFARGGPAQTSKLGESRDESDEATDRRAARAAAREKLRHEFCNTAAQRHAELPEPLREIFGPEQPVKEANRHLRLEDCLRRFSVVEALEDEFKPVYRCSSCAKADRGKAYASRRLWLWQADLPPLLTLQLKRFRRYFQRFEKSTASIQLPTVLDLGDFVLTEPQFQSLMPFLVEGLDLQERLPVESSEKSGPKSLRYELYGICVHQGSTMASGHYVAYVNSGTSLEHEAWFGISDTKVWSCTRAEVLKAEAYIAFYRREGSGETAAAQPAVEVPTAASAGSADDEEEPVEGASAEDEA